MSIRQKLQKALLIGAVGFAVLVAPVMNPNEIDELLRRVNVPKVAQTLRQSSDSGDGPPEGLDSEDE